MRRDSVVSRLLVFLLITSLYAAVFLQFPAVSAAGAATFGCATVGRMSRAFGGIKDASRFWLKEGGAIQSVTVYFATSGFSAKVAVYTDLKGAPSSLIVQSGGQIVDQTGWTTFTVPQKTLAAGYYWLTNG